MVSHTNLTEIKMDVRDSDSIYLEAYLILKITINKDIINHPSFRINSKLTIVWRMSRIDLNVSESLDRLLVYIQNSFDL